VLFRFDVEEMEIQTRNLHEINIRRFDVETSMIEISHGSTRKGHGKEEFGASFPCPFRV
jgi:hypothetical protein